MERQISSLGQMQGPCLGRPPWRTNDHPTNPYDRPYTAHCNFGRFEVEQPIGKQPRAVTPTPAGASAYLNYASTANAHFTAMSNSIVAADSEPCGLTGKPNDSFSEPQQTLSLTGVLPWLLFLPFWSRHHRMSLELCTVHSEFHTGGYSTLGLRRRCVGDGPHAYVNVPRVSILPRAILCVCSWQFLGVKLDAPVHWYGVPCSAAHQGVNLADRGWHTGGPLGFLRYVVYRVRSDSWSDS